MSTDNKENDPQSGDQELPDYVDDSVASVPSEPWLSKPGNRKLLVRGVILVVLLAIAPGAYRAVKNWRAESLLTKSGSAFAMGDSQQGIALLKQSLALSPGNLAVQHAVELYNARAGDKDSLAKLTARMRAGESDNEELLGLADLEAHAGHIELAREALARVPKHTSSKEALRVALIKAALTAQEGNLPKAAEICLSEGWNSLGKEERDRLRTRGALYLLSQKGTPESTRAAVILMGVVQARTAASLPAWRIMTQLALSPAPEASGVVTPAQLTELMKVLPSLKGSGSSDRLLAADLEIKLDPSSLAPLVERMTKEFRHSPRNEMLGYARWLNSKRLPKETIAFAGQELPRSDTDWLLVVLDAQSGQGHWQEVVGMLDSPAGAGIPEAVKHLFLARMAIMTGNENMSQDEWRNVGAALHLEKPETLAYIAGYEEQIGAFDRAARTYREMADRKETQVPGLIGLIKCQPRTASAASMIPIYEELLAASPDFSEASGDVTYLKLLVGEDIPESAATAEKLLAAEPNSLPRISTAALGRLRLGDARGALALYEGKVVDWTVAPEPWKVVHIAVLRANGDTDGAAMQSATLIPSVLRQEERELLNPPGTKNPAQKIKK